MPEMDDIQKYRPDQLTRPSRPQWQFRLYHLFIAIAVVAVLLALIQTVRMGMGDARPAAFKAHCASNQRRLAIALNAYHDDHDSYPPAYLADAKGRPLHSWRVLLLPYLGERALYDQYRFDEPWNSPNNIDVAKAGAHFFRCPLAAGGKKSQVAQYVAIVGPETIWPGAETRQRNEITDGPAGTILLMEWHDSDILWTEPRDLPLEKLIQMVQPSVPIRSHRYRHDDGFNIVTADASTRFIKLPIPPNVVRAMATAASGDLIREE